MVERVGVSRMGFFFLKIAFFGCGTSSNIIDIVGKLLSSNFKGTLKLHNWTKITPILQQVDFALYIFLMSYYAQTVGGGAFNDKIYIIMTL